MTHHDVQIKQKDFKCVDSLESLSQPLSSTFALNVRNLHPQLLQKSGHSNVIYVCVPQLGSFGYNVCTAFIQPTKRMAGQSHTMGPKRRQRFNDMKKTNTKYGSPIPLSFASAPISNSKISVCLCIRNAYRLLLSTAKKWRALFQSHMKAWTNVPSQLSWYPKTKQNN